MIERAIIQEKVVAIVAHQLEKKIEEIGVSESLINQAADELDLIEMVMRFEEQFNLEINDADADGLLTVEAVVEYVSHRINKI